MHRMILMDADFQEVKAVVVAKRKNADVAQVAEPLIRNEKGGSSSDPIGPNSDMYQKWEDTFERLAEID